MLSNLDREARDMAWELSIMEEWGCQETDKYKRLKERFFKIVNTARRLRGIKPMEQEEYEQIQLERILYADSFRSSNKGNL